jgi:hypothetical protein
MPRETWGGRPIASPALRDAEGGGYFCGPSYFSTIPNWTTPAEMKRSAGRLVPIAKRLGLLPKELSPCIGPGPHTGRVVGHHPDYAFPFAIVPLCDSCHLRIHSGAIPEPGTGRQYPTDSGNRSPEKRAEARERAVRLKPLRAAIRARRSAAAEAH